MLKVRQGRCPTSGQQRGPLGRASTPPLVRRPLVGPAKSLLEMSVRSFIHVECLLGIATQHVEVSHHSGVQKYVYLPILDIREGRLLRQLLRQEESSGRSDIRGNSDSWLIRGNSDSWLNGNVHADLQASKLDTVTRIPPFRSVDEIGSPTRSQSDPRIEAFARHEVIRALDTSRGGPVVVGIAC